MYYIILNPKARAGYGRKIWTQLSEIFDELEYKLYKTEYEGHAVKIASEITTNIEPNDAHLIVIGGDGTLNEVINGIRDLKKVTIGYVPLGSGNDFVRGMNMTMDPIEMAKRIVHPSEYKEIDIGYITYGDNKKRRFNISSGFGWEAAICHIANIDSKVKKGLNKIGFGKLTYFVLAFKVLAGFKRYQVKVKTNDNEYTFKNVLFMACMNLPCEGGGYRFRPDAGYNTGKLHFVVAHDLTYLNAIRVLIGAKDAKHLKYKKHIDIFDAKEAVASSVYKQDIHVDGQPVFARNEVKYQLEKDRLKYIV